MMGYGWGMGSGWIFMVSFWVLLVVVVVWAVSRLAPRSENPHAPTTQRETPLEILERRLASGEIEPEEFVRLREQLSLTSKGEGESR